MQVKLTTKPVNAIESTAVLHQTAFWADVKKQQGWKACAFDIHIPSDDLSLKKDTDKHPGNATDDIMVVLRKVNREKYIAYVPYGPVIEPDPELQGQLLEELSESLRPFLPSGCMLIRYDLRWESAWANDEDRYDLQHRWLGPPEPAIQEMRMNFNTTTGNLRKSSSDNLPSNTIFIGLEKETNQLLQKMKPKTRYNIQLSQRKGVVVKDVSADNLPVWYNLYKETAIRNGIYLQGIEYFESIVHNQQAHSASPARVHLLMAEANGLPLAGMFLAIAGGRATYLYGASSTELRNFMGTYALQWEAIKIAKASGCREYDMFGVSQPGLTSHPLYGLYRFKSGFGGYLYHRMGCWDYPLLQNDYNEFRSHEMNSRGFHIKNTVAD